MFLAYSVSVFGFVVVVPNQKHWHGHEAEN